MKTTRHKPIPKQSVGRAVELAKHPAIRKAFLDTHDICFRCGHYVARRQRQLHHYFGRILALLNWVPGFRLSCGECHRWVETHRNDSVRLGFRAPDNLFNRPSLVITETERLKAVLNHMKEPPRQVSASVRRLNPHLYGMTVVSGVAPTGESLNIITKPLKRIRQSTKPLLNLLEKEWLAYAQPIFHENIMSQAIAFRLGNGVVYWPDFVSQSFTHAWEIKGSQPIQDDAVVKIKVAARLFPQIRWSLAWKNFNGAWIEQKVLT